MVIERINQLKTRKSRTTNKVESMDYNNWSPGPEQPNNKDHGVPKAIFVPHADSLPFEERHVTLEQPVKIGRFVYRSAPSSTNTIFECRVLSRHHATIYYDKGHFYLVDNQSSNGTFINNNRCSLSKDQEPHEVFSGDVVQFGISVVENAANNEKNTFPPVVALLKLYHADGKEAKLTFNPTLTTPLHLNELYQLNNCVQEAVQREALLESRLKSLRESVERTRAEARASWELFVGEQQLLMRVHTLENMLAVGKQPELHHVTQLLDDKRNYQEVAVERLRAAHEARLALEEALERRSREAAALRHHNYALRLAANTALADLQKVASLCERKMCAARLAVAAAEEREASLRAQLPLTYSVQNGEAKMLVLSSDSNRLLEDSNCGNLLEDAVRSLPDYIKLLLPSPLLSNVGIKSVSADGKTAKEFELILKTNNVYESETNDKQTDEEGVVGGSGEEKSAAETRAGPDSCTDDEKQCRLNHDGREGDTTNTNQIVDGELLPDNNANSEPNTREDTPSKGEVEYANILRVIAGLNEEIKTLRERLAAASRDNEQLRGVRDELLAAAAPLSPPSPPLPPSPPAPPAPLAPLDESELARAAAAVRSLAAVNADLQAQLALRPTREDLDGLAGLVAELRAQLAERRPSASHKATETDPSPEPADLPDGDHIAERIDRLFELDDDDESVTTELELACEPRGAALDESEWIEREARARTTLANGSLHALEEELVRTKEQWAAADAERARLEARVAALRGAAGARGAAAWGAGARGAGARGAAGALLAALVALLVWWLLPALS